MRAETRIPEQDTPARRHDPPAPAVRARRRRRRPRRGVVAMWAGTAIVGLFLLAPIVVVAVFSFNSEKSLNAFAHPSLRWYRTVLHDDNLLASTRLSLEVALMTAVVATVIGTLFAFGLARARTRWTRPPQAVLIATLVTPEIATAVAQLLIFTSGLHLTLSRWTLTAAHITFSLVYVTLIVRTRLAGLRPEVEEAARDLGCTDVQALRLVVLPQLAPAVVGAALLVFVLSFDDFITSTFTTGAGTSPLPVYIYGQIKFGLSPEINAVGSLMLVVTVVAGALGVLLMRAASRRSAAHR